MPVSFFQGFFSVLRLIIVDRVDSLWSPANIKGANKDAKIYVGRSRTVHNILFCPHTLCMNYVTNMLLLVSFSVRSKQLLCFVHRQGQKSEQKHKTKNFVEFHNHSPLLTMLMASNTKRANLTWLRLEIIHRGHTWHDYLGPRVSLTWLLYNLQLWVHRRWFRKFTVCFGQSEKS